VATLNDPIATSQLARFTFYAIMSSGDPSAPCPSTAPSKSEKAIQHACDIFRVLFLPEDDDDKIQQRLSISWFNVHSAISQAGDLNQKERLRNESEFNAYVTARGSNGERKRELIKLLRSMAKQEVPWRNLFQNGTFFIPLTTSTLIIIFYL
jgi:hypothetical protein